MRSETLFELGDELRTMNVDLVKWMDGRDARPFDGRKTDNRLSVVTLFRKEMV